MTNEEWQQLEEKEAVLGELEKQYKRPRYDPFEIFKPSKAFIKEVIKQLNNHPYASTQHIFNIEKEFGYLPSYIAQEKQKILKRIKQYKYWLARGVNNREIGESEIQRAKEVPISSLYNGVLKQKGRTSVGHCPFHDERTPSFTIFLDKNIWRCFGCSNFGDSIDFITLRDDLDFPTAVRKLINL